MHAENKDYETCLIEAEDCPFICYGCPNLGAIEQSKCDNGTENTPENARKFLADWVKQHGINWDETSELADVLVGYAKQLNNE